MNNQPEISIDDLQPYVGDDVITLLPFPTNAVNELSKSCVASGFDLHDFYMGYFMSKSALSPATYLFAFRNKTGYSQKIFLSDPFLWPRGDYYSIRYSLINYKRTGIVT